MSDISAKNRTGIVVIQGPTASGKSELAARLAEAIGAEIINADSMQVYRAMDIGTAKPSLMVRERVPHHLIDILYPDEEFSAADFRRAAILAIEQIRCRGNRCIVVGGTGLYIRALLQGLVASPRGDSKLRDELKRRAASEGNRALLDELVSVDPDTAGLLHVNDQVRIIRAMEVFLQTGVPISRYRAEHGFNDNQFNVLKLGITLPKDELYRRIDQRVDAMIAGGLVDEVAGLLRSGYAPGIKALRSIGYKEISAFLRGDCTLEESIHLMKQSTRRYAKRQLTWFNKDHEIKWVEYPESFANICNHVIEFFAKGEDHGKGTL